ncbi:MAG: hypothetical protein FJ011_14620 [Chloroflexi bacterium]|nr:hypothetical protein [Chloroflexota bacterium]
MFILLTGKEHVGKTTACWKALPALRADGLRIAGFVSPPLLSETGAKVGIQMVNLTTGESQTLARVAAHGEPATVGQYRMADEASEWARRVLAAALLANADWIVVDEIGPWELHQDGGFAFALEPLGDPVRVPNAIVIVRESLADELAERVGRTDVVRLLVTPANRSKIPAQLFRLICAAP